MEIASKQGNGEYFGAPYAALPMGVGGTVHEGLARGLRFGFVGCYGYEHCTTGVIHGPGESASACRG